MTAPALLAALLAVQATPSKDEARARELLRQVEDRYRSARSLAYSATVSGEQGGGAASGEVALEAALAGRDRLKLQTRYRSFGADAFTVLVARGRESVEYRSAVGEHVTAALEAGLEPSKMPDPAGHLYLGGTIDAYLPGGGGAPGSTWEVVETAASATLTCRVVRTAEAGVVQATATLVVDPAARALLGWSTEKRAGDNLLATQKIAYKETRFDPPLADATFLWTPPPDSRKVERFSDPALLRLHSLVGKPPPETALETLDGAKTTLAETLRGSVGIVCLFSTQHPGCLMAVNHLNTLHERYGRDGIRIVLVTAEAPEALQDYLKTARPGPKWENPFLRAPAGLGEPFNLAPELPAVFLVDRKGVLRHVALGGSKDSKRYVREVGMLLGE